ncbi:hypothetical protein HanLR1_Chr10g0364011 [Helianthus annuus]|nr:hypothetical protein HanLR1_Chr10g0364011 [Helianthus annuus]
MKKGNLGEREVLKCFRVANSLRLMALKKAYANIILNTEKEVAKRIMVSDRKAVMLEYELKVAKEDAVQMLMRIKQMMDCKICFGLRFEKGLGLCCLGVWFRFRF